MSMLNPQENKIRKKNERAILKAAVCLFAEKGFDGARTTEIAKASGLPKANIYYYFASKEEIYTRLIEELIAGWDKALEHISIDSDPQQAIAAYVEAKLKYSRQHPTQSRFFANEMLSGGRFFTRKQKNHIKTVTKKHIEVLEHWIKQKKLKPVNANHFFIILWASTEYYGNFTSLAALTLDKSRLSKQDFNDAKDAIIKTVLDGCLIN